MTPRFIQTFFDPDVSLTLAGGKGLNLARLTQAGFPVPAGWILTTDAYHSFCSQNGLREVIRAALDGLNIEDPSALEEASARLRAAFSAGRIPEAVKQELLAAWRELGAAACAVRSSATAEDLPGVSFAGQQDTYLNIRGETNLLEAVRRCWGSLWSPRAIAYRARQGIEQEGLALAVVLQVMINSQVSGVMFTANPVSGLRKEIVIDAAYGLGEALVSGQVEPDHYTVQANGAVEKRLGSKDFSLHPSAGSGLDPRRQDRRAQQALSDEQIAELADLGKRIEQIYGEPQDIEWALEGGRFYVLQSRAITTLYPLPARADDGCLHIYFAFSAVQGMPLAMTPVGIDLLRAAFAKGAGLFGLKRTAETQGALFEAGFRLFSDATTLVRSPLGRKVIPTVLSFVEPTLRQILLSLWDDPRLLPVRKRTYPITYLRLGRFFLPAIINVARILISPQHQVQRRKDWLETQIDRLTAEINHLPDDPAARLSAAIRLTDALVASLPAVLRKLIPCIAAGMASYNAVYQLSRRLPGETLPPGQDGAQLAVKVTRGMPGNATTEMDLKLWQTARVIRGDPDARRLFQTSEPAELARQFLAGQLPPAAQNSITDFLKIYGMRGVGEIDMGRPRWQDDPGPIFEILASYLAIEDEHAAPQAVFERSVMEAETAVATLTRAARQTRAGWLKSRLIRFFAGRARAILGMRESPKFFIVRMTGHLRSLLLRCGADLAGAGVLSRPDDIVFLTLAELKQLASGQSENWKEKTAARRAGYDREMRRKLLPRVMLSDGRCFYEGLANHPDAGAHLLTGSPVSPGLVEAPVRIVHDPRSAGLQPGEILVCHGTDPAWTPLFLAASGLIMEVGGMMTHGAVVAREYGIPAVVGVDQAMQRLKTGQVVRLNGSSGFIEIVNP